IVVAINDQESPRLAILAVRVECHRDAGGDVTKGDLVQSERISREALARVYVDLVLKGGNSQGHSLSAYARKIGPAGHEWLFVHPNDVSCKLVRYLRPRSRCDKNVAARYVDVVHECESYRIACFRSLE